MPSGQNDDFVTVADVEVDAVRPIHAGFVLEGRGADSADYRLEMHLEVPMDARTRTALGELLAQSEWRVRRRVATRVQNRARRPQPGLGEDRSRRSN